MKRVLFVCTGNIFRSMTAEHALRHVLGRGGDIAVESAGTEAVLQEMPSYLSERLDERGIDVSAHCQRRVSDEILSTADLVVAMGLNHRDILRDRFQCEALLFYQVLRGEERPLLDINEALPDWQSQPEKAIAYAVSVVDLICDAMPEFADKLRARLQ